MLISRTTRILNIQAKRDIETKNNKRACLLKSRTLEVIGKKNIGNKKINAYRLYFEIKSQTLIADDVSFAII